MTLAETPGLAGCAGCTIARPAAAVRVGDTLLSLPAIHCSACIATVERTLEGVPGVLAARVNLTQKRVSVDAPGIAPEALIAALAAAGVEAQELDPGALAGSDRVGRELLVRLGLAGFAMMNVMLLSVAVWAGAAEGTRELFHWISALIALPAVAICGQPFFRSAGGALRAGRLNMDVPISLAILLASGMSLYETAYGGHTAWFDAALALTFFLLAGRYLDHRTRVAARSAAAELAALEVPRAVRLTAEGEAVVPVAALRPGDRVRVRPGARVPADGVVTEGESELDRSLLTGESLPEPVASGGSVAAGEVNLTGPLVLRVTAAGRDTVLGRLRDLVAVAEAARSRYTSLADRAARIYAPLIHLLGAATFAGWLLATGDVRLALNVAVATLIITCPCALGLAVPAVSTAATGRLFRRGLLVKDATALERLAEVDTVVFDKTGTLTAGEPVLTDAVPPRLAPVALALAQGSSHPLAQALATALREAGVVPAPLGGVVEVPGNGLEAEWEGARVRLGRADWVGAKALDGTASYLSAGGEVHAFGFAERLRPGAAETVDRLRKAGFEVALLSGDAPAPVAAVAARLGIERWEARVAPEEKARRLQALSREGRRILMVGDGLNDTGALAAAHASIAPASALDAARVVSDMVLLGRDLGPVADAVVVARSAVRRIRENFAVAALYNLVAIPLAMAGFATPLAAAIAMSTSSIVVSLNALRVRG